MRSQLDNRISGTGMNHAFYESEESYENVSVHVRLTNDPVNMKDDAFETLCRSMASEVTTYFMGVK